MKKYKIAVLDDYQNVALQSADGRGSASDNVLATPHIGYVLHGLYETFYEDTVSNIRKWLDAHWHPDHKRRLTKSSNGERQ